MKKAKEELIHDLVNDPKRSQGLLEVTVTL